MEPWRTVNTHNGGVEVCMPMMYHYKENQDPDLHPVPHQSEMLDPDPHQGERRILNTGINVELQN
jgi:hypothetical protein